MTSATHTESFTIPKRSSWGSAVTVEIACAPDAPPTVKLGLAVKVAYQTDANLRGANLTDADLTDADLTDANLRGANLRGADLTDANLTDADLTVANLMVANLMVANLMGADLTDADLRGANLRGANLMVANLMVANLRGANLRGANLRGANLTGANLTGANLWGANLWGANLTGADLRGADLTDANLWGEKIERIFASANRLDGYTFYGVQLQAGGYKVHAGCRWYTDAEFRAHVAAEYPGTGKATETLAILDFIAARATQVGALAKAEQVAA